MSGGEGESVQIVEDWWMEGGMGVIDVGETAVVHIGEAALPGPVYFLRSVVARQRGENVRCMDPMARDTKGVHA
jgi:hypothetical protein